MSLFDNFGSWPLFGLVEKRQALSAAGRMLRHLDDADDDARACPVTDELTCALKRAFILARREK